MGQRPPFWSSLPSPRWSVLPRRGSIPREVFPARCLSSCPPLGVLVWWGSGRLARFLPFPECPALWGVRFTELQFSSSALAAKQLGHVFVPPRTPQEIPSLQTKPTVLSSGKAAGTVLVVLFWFSWLAVFLSVCFALW